MRNLHFDGFLSAIMAAESFIGGRAIMHGPGGCSDYSTRISSTIVPRDHVVIEGPYFFNNPRVPCTHVDEEDYINGADYKVTELLDRIDDCEMCVIIPSPGMSLIGDDIIGAASRSRFDGITVTTEASYMSEPASVGYDSMISKIVRTACKDSEKVKGRVNLIGLPVILHGWESTVEELRSYIDAMGLELCAAVGAGCTVKELRESASAEYNICVLPEYCRLTSEVYDELGVPTICSVIPIGFEGTSEWIRSIANATGKDLASALEILRRSELRAKRLLEGSSMKGFSTRCATYSISIDSEITMPLMEWLYRYLFMFPECVHVSSEWSAECKGRIFGFLESIDRSEAVTADIDSTKVDVMFTDGISAEFMQKKGTCSAGIDMWMPTRHTMPFVDRPILGAKGSLRLLDDIFYSIQRSMYH